MERRLLVLAGIGAAILGVCLWRQADHEAAMERREAWALSQGALADEPPAPKPAEGNAALAAAALEETKRRVTYDPAYVKIPYPGGDVPADRGVCADVIVRAYRRVGTDLQKEVHEDMAAHFRDYPQLWKLARPDPNIDHRRVPNLMTFLKRKGAGLTASEKAEDYLPGDVVAWDLGKGVLHIGVVSSRKSADGKLFQMVHNVGAGQVLEDVLFAWKVIGHYRWKGPGPYVRTSGPLTPLPPMTSRS